MQVRRFANREEAGRLLGQELLRRLGKTSGVIVLALPRGGVPVGSEVARALDAPLDVFVVRKLGVPGEEELAMGAIGSGGVRVLNDEILQYIRVPQAVFDAIAEREQSELERREIAYRGKRPPLDVEGDIVVIVDDGLATGSTMRAAVRALRAMNPRAIVAAVPVAAASTCRSLRPEVDDLVCLRTPDPFEAVGLWYDDFTQTTDDEVRALLDAHEPAVGRAGT